MFRRSASTSSFLDTLYSCSLKVYKIFACFDRFWQRIRYFVVIFTFGYLLDCLQNPSHDIPLVIDELDAIIDSSIIAR